MAGFVKAHRDLLTHRYFQNEKLFKIMMYCLFKASHKDHSVIVGIKNVELKKGQFVFGRKVASTELNMTESTVWKYIKFLEKDKFISVNSNNKYSVVTIDNWASYQVQGEESNNKVTTKKQQSNTYKKGKNEKKEYTVLFEYWNSKQIIVHKSINIGITNAIDKALKIYNGEDIKKMIDRYYKILIDEDYFFSYRWTLKDFLSRKDGISSFTDEGSKWCDYSSRNIPQKTRLNIIQLHEGETYEA